MLREEWLEDEYGLYKQADGLEPQVQMPQEKKTKFMVPNIFLADGSDFYTTQDDLPLESDHIALWPITIKVKIKLVLEKRKS